jgi:hypothetical protein
VPLNASAIDNAEIFGDGPLCRGPSPFVYDFTLPEGRRLAVRVERGPDRPRVPHRPGVERAVRRPAGVAAWQSRLETLAVGGGAAVLAHVLCAALQGVA